MNSDLLEMGNNCAWAGIKLRDNLWPKKSVYRRVRFSEGRAPLNERVGEEETW